MANWDRIKPKGMSREELEKRTKAGLLEWERKGWVRPGFNQKQIKGTVIAKADGPHLDRVGRKRVMNAANLAIYALANGDRDDYVGAVRVINATRRMAGMSTVFMQAMCDGIADAAAAASGTPRAHLDMVARTWLHQDLNGGAGRIISLPSKGANDDGKKDGQDPARNGGGRGEGGQEQAGPEAEGGARGAGDQALEAPGEDDEPELQPGEGGHGAGREGGPEPADDPDHGGSGSLPREPHGPAE